MSFPSHVIVEVRDPNTNMVLWRHDHVPAEILMQIASSVQMAKGMAERSTNVVKDVSDIVSDIKSLFKKAKL